jgi:hypothetical protein
MRNRLAVGLAALAVAVVSTGLVSTLVQAPPGTCSGAYLPPEITGNAGLARSPSGPPAGLRATVFGVASVGTEACVDQALAWLGLGGPTRATLASELRNATFVSRLLIENPGTIHFVLSEPHARARFQAADGRAYRATLRTAGSPGVLLAPGLAARALVYGNLPAGSAPAKLLFGHADLPDEVSLEVSAEMASSLPRVANWQALEARRLGARFEPGERGITAWVEALNWPEVVVAVHNDSPRPFLSYADHTLHVALYGSDGTLVDTEPAAIDLATVPVESQSITRYRFAAPAGTPLPPEAKILVASYRELQARADVQGMAIYDPESG